MQEYLRQLREQFQRLSPVQKWIVGGSAGFILLVFLVLLTWTSSPDYLPLFRGLDLKEASQIKSRLDTLNIPYRLEDGGQSIYIPSERKSEVMLALAEEDMLPKRAQGWAEILGPTSPLNQSKEIIDLNVRRGLQGELEQTILSMEGVVSTRVLIFEAKERIFSEDQKPDQASVSIEMKPGMTLGRRQVGAIRNLVANATGVAAEQIRIIDKDMNDLTEQLDDDGSQMSDRRLQLQNQIAQAREKKVQSTLDKVLGPGRSKVNVAVELSFDQEEVHSKELAPPVEGEDTGVLVSEETLTENYEGLSPVREGEPGVGSNIPPSYPGVKKGQTKYGKDERKRNIDYNETKKHTVKALGVIKRLTVSAIIDEVIEDGQIAPLKDAIAAAVGFNAARGDEITVIRFPFNRADQKEKLARERRERLQEMIAKIAIVATPVLFLLVIFVILWRRWEARIEELEPDVLDITEIREPEEEEQEDLISPEQREQHEKISSIRSMATGSPDSMAKLLQIWLSEE